MTTEGSKGYYESYRVLGRSMLQRAIGFKDCPNDLLDELVAGADFLRLEPRDVLIRRGERAQHIVLLVDGMLDARVGDGSQTEHLLGFVLPGMTVGFLSFVDGGPMSHDLIARIPALALRMAMKEVRRLSLIWPELLLAIQTQLAERLRTLYDGLIYSKTFSLRERVITQLVLLADRVGRQRGDRWAIDLPMSQSDLADLVGAGRQSVNAELRRLQALKLVRITRSHLDVLDLDGLRAQLSGDNPTLRLHLT